MSRSLNHIGPGDQLVGKQPYTLTGVIGRGGEGTVYRLANAPALAAKVYLQEPDKARIKKLNVMTAMNQPALTRYAAWPQEVLCEPGSNQPVGFIMPLYTGARPLYTIINPMERLTTSPKVGLAVLAGIAVNLARMVETVHAAGGVIGDLSAANILLAWDGTVRLIDCDSLQVGNPSDKLRCTVGLDDMLAPELQGKDLARIERTPNHDAFPLAVILFQLLCFGRHPYAGSGERGIQHAIRRNRHGLRRWSRRSPLKPLGLSAETVLSPALIELFRGAFNPGWMRNRPTTTQWITALEHFQASLVQCRANTTHQHQPSRSGCPWCAIERRGKPSMFEATPAKALRGTRWHAITRLLRMA